MQATRNLDDLTSTSLQHAHDRMQAADFDAAIAIVRKLIALLYENMHSPHYERHLCYSFECLADAHFGADQHEEALKYYEQTLTGLEKVSEPTSAQAMLVLYKMEQTLSIMSTDVKYARATEEWRASSLLANMKGSDFVDVEPRSDMPPEELNKLWKDNVTTQSLRRKNIIQKKSSLQGAFRSLKGLGYRLMAIPALILVIGVIVGIFSAMKSKDLSVSTIAPLRNCFTAPSPVRPAPPMAIPPNATKFYCSGDESKKIAIRAGKCVHSAEGGPAESISLLCVSDHSPVTMFKLFHDSLLQDNLWLMPTAYGLEDQAGYVYLDEATPEYAVVAEMQKVTGQIKSVNADGLRQAAKGKFQPSKGLPVRDILSYNNPFVKAKAHVVVSDSSKASIREALSDISMRAIAMTPGTIICGIAANGQEILLCGIDRDNQLIPIGSKFVRSMTVRGQGQATIKPERPKNIKGIIVLPVRDPLLYYGATGTCLFVALVVFGMAFSTRKAVVRTFLLGSGCALLLLAYIGYTHLP